MQSPGSWHRCSLSRLADAPTAVHRRRDLSTAGEQRVSGDKMDAAPSAVKHHVKPW